MRPLPSSGDHRGWIAVVAVALLLSSAAALAQEQQAAPKPGPTPTVEATPVAPSASATAETAAPQPATQAPAAKVRPLSPMMVEMQALLAAEHEQLAELQQRVKAAVSPDDALALQRRIEQVKFETEISLLRVQAKHARQAGRNEVATRIETAITDLLNPPKLGTPAARPVPTRETPSH